MFSYGVAKRLTFELTHAGPKGAAREAELNRQPALCAVICSAYFLSLEVEGLHFPRFHSLLSENLTLVMLARTLMVLSGGPSPPLTTMPAPLSMIGL